MSVPSRVINRNNVVASPKNVRPPYTFPGGEANDLHARNNDDGHTGVVERVRAHTAQRHSTRSILTT